MSLKSLGSQASRQSSSWMTWSRLDPDHIFRILNILSVHYDNDIDKNKFGFDKVICICDLTNIQSVFHHRYGSAADFFGYIDKFYSEEPFKFNNSDAIATYCQRLEAVQDLPVRAVLQTLLVEFVNRGALTVRQILRHSDQCTCNAFHRV